MRKSLIVGVAALVCAVAGAVDLQARARTSAAAAEKSQAQAAAAAIPVLVGTAEAKDVPIILRGLGTVEAFNAVSLKSRVEGAITKMSFKEGQEVHAGARQGSGLACQCTNGFAALWQAAGTELRA